MCGLYGVYANRHLTTLEKDALVDLGSISYLRGSDSTGFATVTKKRPKSPKIGFNITKRVEHPVDFFVQKEVLDQIYRPNVTCVIGHSRAATHGVVNEINAHPVREGNIIGAHNGVVKRYEPAKSEENNFTDSRKLFSAIDKGNLEDVLADLNWGDAYALTFLDIEYNTLNFIRNDKRPLFFVRTKEGVMYWCSEMHMIKFALGRNSLEVEASTELKPGTLFSTCLLTGEPNQRELKLDKPWSSGVFTPPRTPEPTGTAVTKPGYFPPDSDDFYAARIGHMQEYMEKSRGRVYLGYREGPIIQPTAEEVLKAIRPGMGVSRNDNVVDMSTWEQDLKDMDDKGNESVYPFLRRPDWKDTATYQIRKHGIPQWVSVLVAESYLRHGCDYCNAKSSVEDTVYWYSPSEHLCSDCYEFPIVKDYYKHHKDFIKNDIILDTHVSLYGG